MPKTDSAASTSADLLQREAKTNTYRVPAVDRAVRIMKVLQRQRRMTVTDIAQAVDIGPSSCFSILKTLQHHSLIAFDERAKTYSLGLGLLELGGSVSRHFREVGKARAHLIEYTRNTGLTTFVVARASHERLLVVDREEPAGQFRISITVGTRFRITEGLSGRCFMAFLPQEESNELLETVGLYPFAGLPAPSVAAYRAELRRARACGYVVLANTPASGSNGVAAPVFDGEGRILFAVAAMGLSPALSAKAIKETGASLRRTTDIITESLNAGGS